MADFTSPSAFASSTNLPTYTAAAALRPLVARAGRLMARSRSQELWSPWSIKIGVIFLALGLLGGALRWIL